MHSKDKVTMVVIRLKMNASMNEVMLSRQHVNVMM